MEIAASVLAEIQELHAEFERLFRGRGEPNLDRIQAALHPEFTLVTPQGILVGRDELLGKLRAAIGARAVAIRIEHPSILWQEKGVIAAVYEEWQQEGATTTGRLSTAILVTDATAPCGVRWRHVHETWMESSTKLSS